MRRQKMLFEYSSALGFSFDDRLIFSRNLLPHHFLHNSLLQTIRIDQFVILIKHVQKAKCGVFSWNSTNRGRWVFWILPVHSAHKRLCVHRQQNKNNENIFRHFFIRNKFSQILKKFYFFFHFFKLQASMQLKTGTKRKNKKNLKKNRNFKNFHYFQNTFLYTKK